MKNGPATAKDLAALSAQAIREQAKKLTEEIATRVKVGEDEAKRISILGMDTGASINEAIEHFAKQTEGLMEYLRETEELCREASASIMQLAGHTPSPTTQEKPLPSAHLEMLERDIVRGIKPMLQPFQSEKPK